MSWEVTLIRQIALCLIVLCAGLSAGITPEARAATNSVYGGIGGIDNGTLRGGDGTGAATITLHSTRLALVKTARDADGELLPDGTTVVPGQEIYFVLHVDNPTLYPAENITLSDQLIREQFSYIPGSMEFALVPTDSSDETLWTGTWTNLTDAVGLPDDIAAFIEGGETEETSLLTIGAVPGQTNKIVTLPSQTRLAIRFRVRVK